MSFSETPDVSYFSQGKLNFFLVCSAVPDPSVSWLWIYLTTGPLMWLLASLRWFGVALFKLEDVERALASRCEWKWCWLVFGWWRWIVLFLFEGRCKRRYWKSSASWTAGEWTWKQCHQWIASDLCAGWRKHIWNATSWSFFRYVECGYLSMLWMFGTMLPVEWPLLKLK